jgi:glyoxylase-like metal-dependent hydrolase (beta-lactamase superfamily II)
MGYVNAFFLAADEVTLIDSGLRNRAQTLLKAVGQAGKKPEDLKHIAITHHHADHAGSLAALVEATGARSYVHSLDAPVVAGERAAPGAGTRLGKLLAPILNLIPASHADPARVDQKVEDGEVLPIAGGLRVLHTPGHTAGHVCYLWPANGGVLFAGDAAGRLFGRLGPPFGMYTEDMRQAKESIRKIAALEFGVACFGHGRVLKGQAHAEFRRLVEKMAG